MNYNNIVLLVSLGISFVAYGNDNDVQEVDIPTDTMQITISPNTGSDSFNFDMMTDSMERFEEEHDVDFGAVKDIPEWQVLLRKIFTPVFMRYVVVHQYVKEKLYALVVKVGLYGS